MIKYSESQRREGLRVRFENMAKHPPPEIPVERENGFLVMFLNDIWTIVNLKPVGKITQWESVFNGQVYKECSGMNCVYKHVAFLNPPARNFE